MANVRGGGKFIKALESIATSLSKAKSVQVGFFENAKYPDGTSVAMVAAIQNYGAPKVGIPPRPFFSNMIAEKSPSWPAAIEANLKATNYDAELTLERVGQGIADQLKQSIRDTNSPPLKQATIDRKGFDKPLIDTAHMINSVTFQVKS